jgi:DNA modification methylase
MACFEAQHQALDAVWAECARVLADGGFLCVNIGDATRSLNDQFCLYPNHARILTAAMRLGLTPLPDILWRKPNNSPNKFMGSGTLPAGAYVTYEHEYILILRKGGKRQFSKEEQARRAASAYFWEERNQWFSDLWTDLLGADQRLLDPEARARSAAYPLELPYRLILMYSIEGDVVLDPFVGTGTTPVVTRQEALLQPLIPVQLSRSGETWTATHAPAPGLPAAGPTATPAPAAAARG